MSSPTLVHEFEWTAPSVDPNDEEFGDVVVRHGLGNLGALEPGQPVLVGEPDDGGVLGRPGAAAGPAAIREALAGVKTHHFDAGPVAGAGPAVADLGDVDFRGVGGVATAQELVREVAREVHESDALPVFLGGDNSMTVGNVGGLLDAVGGGTPDSGTSESGDPPPVGVLNFDAHLDVRAVREAPTSGTPYRQLYAEGLADYACVGARHFETSTAYHDFLRERGGTVVTSEEVGEDPVAAVSRALEVLDAAHLFLSVDLDVLDATAAPGVSAPTPGGLTTRDLFRAVRVAAGDPRVAGLEVVECAPPLDRDGRTVAAAARTVAHFLAAQGVAA